METADFAEKPDSAVEPEIEVVESVPAEVPTAEDAEKAAWRRLAVTGGLIVALAVASAAAGATVIGQISGPSQTQAAEPPVITDPASDGQR